MLTNPLLGEMSVEDLNQRYANTYVKYGEEVLRIVEFWSNEHTMTVMDDEGRTTQRTFEWELLDTSRPPSRWYLHPGTKGAAFAYYFLHGNGRQYHRGYTGNNGTFHRPDDPGMASFPQNLRLAYKLKDIPIEKVRITTAELMTQLARCNDMQLQEQLMIMGNCRYGSYPIYYRYNKVGVLLPSNGKVQMFNNHFVDELKESIVDLDVVLKTNTVTYNAKEVSKTTAKKVTLTIRDAWEAPPQPDREQWMAFIRPNPVAEDLMPFLSTAAASAEGMSLADIQARTRRNREAQAEAIPRPRPARPRR